MIATVNYQVATYSGKITVNCTADEDEDIIIARAKKQLKRNGSLPYGYECFKVISREE